MGRRAARELAMKLLYQFEIQRDNREEQLKMAFEENQIAENEKEFIHDIIDGVFKNVNTIDNIISKHAKGWKINRISKVDLSILRLSIYEICFRDDIPYNVSVNEAVELAKKYSGKEAGCFINGILSKIPKEENVMPIKN